MGVAHRACAFVVASALICVAFGCLPPDESGGFQLKRSPGWREAESAAKVQDLAKGFKRRASVAGLVGGFSESIVRAYVLELSGENSTQLTRHSYSASVSNGIADSAEYIRGKMTEFGFESSPDHWESGTGPNLISVLRGTKYPEELVIMGAHLDDRVANIGDSTGRAPGANDDGSGSSMLLTIAQLIFEANARFERTLVIEHYTGEEQGLRGSRNLAARRALANDTIIAHFQTDMIAVQLRGDPLGLALVQDGRAVDLQTTAIAADIAEAYANSSLAIFRGVLSGSDCCSDHQSYKENGYASVGFIEPRGYTGDPQYHTITDTADRPEYSFEQLALAGEAIFAVVAEFAGLVE